MTGKGTRTDEVIQSVDFYPTILSLLDIPLPEKWPVDGADITPIFKGGKLDRDGAYIYFPHAPIGVPDWLPPSIMLVSGDWKLIRLFHHGDDGGGEGGDELILSNFNEDPAESENLASKYPEKTQHLNRLIEAYIQSVDEKALPVRNPNFRSSKYLRENRGVIRSNWKTPPGGVEGWLEEGTAILEKKQGYMLLESTGKKPYLSSTQLNSKKPLRGGPFKVTFAMKSTSKGPGKLNYRHPFKHHTTIDFKIKHDGLLNEYEVDVPHPQMAGLRIAPGTAPGRVEFSYIKVEDAAGNILKQWNFK